MKRSFSLRDALLTWSGTALIAVSYGLVRLAYGLFVPDVRSDLGFGPATAGWISSGASVAYCVGAAIGFLLARRRARTLVVAAASVAAAGAVGAAVSPDTGVFAVATVLGSASAGMASPALVQLVDERVARPTRTRSQALVNAGTGPGLVLAGVLALVLLPDWRTAWALVGVGAVAVGVVLVSVVLTGSAGSEAAAPARRGGLPDARWFRAHGRLILVATLFGAGTASVWTFGRTVLVDAGAPTATSVVLWIAVGTGGAAVTVTSRWTTGWSARGQWRVTVGTTVVAVLVLGFAPGATGPGLTAGAVFGWGYTAATGALIAWTTGIAPASAPAGTALAFVALVFGQALGAAALGVVIDVAGAAAAFSAAAIVTIASAVLTAGRGRSEDRAELDLPVARS